MSIMLDMLKRFGVVALAGMLILVLVGCDNTFLNNTTPTPDAALTQVAQQVAGLRSELQRVAPTLTALVGVVSTQSTLLAEQSAGLQDLGASLATVVSANPQATLDAAQAIIQATRAPLTDTPTPAEVKAPSQTDMTFPLYQLTPPVMVAGVSLELPSPTPLARAEDVLFQDDFSSQGGWFAEKNDRYSLEFQDGRYSFQVFSKNNPIWSVRAKSFNDVRVEVDTAQVDGPTDGYYGLVCRYQDSGNYYLLVVSPNGNFGIGKVYNKELRYLNFANAYASLLGSDGNRLRADCVGNTLTLYVDGTQVLQAVDDSFASGGVGLVVGNRSTSGTEVLFDNLIVLKPAID